MSGERTVRVRYQVAVAGRPALVGRCEFPVDQWAEMTADEREEVVQAVARGRLAVSWEAEGASVESNQEGGG